MKGFVYIMSNEAMPGIYKIGCTSRNPNERATELYTTGVPTPFIVEYCIYIENYQFIESLIHRNLSNFNYGKEFYKCNLRTCILELKKTAIQCSSYKEKYRDASLRTSVNGLQNVYISEKEKRELEQQRIAQKQNDDKKVKKEMIQREMSELEDNLDNIFYKIFGLSIIISLLLIIFNIVDFRYIILVFIIGVPALKILMGIYLLIADVSNRIRG